MKGRNEGLRKESSAQSCMHDLHDLHDLHKKAQNMRFHERTLHKRPREPQAPMGKLTWQGEMICFRKDGLWSGAIAKFQGFIEGAARTILTEWWWRKLDSNQRRHKRGYGVF